MLITCRKATEKVTEKMRVPPTNKTLKVMKNMRSTAAAASFQSFFLSSSSSHISRSSAAFRFCDRSMSRISITTISSWSVVPDFVSPAGCWPTFWKFTASMLFFLLPTAGGVSGFDEGLMRRYDASFMQISHFICRCTAIINSLHTRNNWKLEQLSIAKPRQNRHYTHTDSMHPFHEMKWGKGKGGEEKERNREIDGK